MAISLSNNPLGGIIFPEYIFKLSPNNDATIGTDVETEVSVKVGSNQRCGGLYILGQPRTGKSNLLVSLALNDTKNKYGIIFIDPHTDAINAMQERIPESRKKEI
jgi:DNA replication protein DnaC